MDSINMENEKFDIETFNKNTKGWTYRFTLDDGTKIEQIGGLDNEFTEWRHPHNKFYKIVKTFYPNLNLKYRGFRLKNLKIGISEHYDEQGNKTIVNEDKIYGKFGYNQLFIFLNERGYVDILKGDWKDVVGLRFDSEKKQWKVEVNNEKGHRILVIDGNSGKILKINKVYVIE